VVASVLPAASASIGAALVARLNRRCLYRHSIPLAGRLPRRMEFPSGMEPPLR
jgi:hypothetical protein